MKTSILLCLLLAACGGGGGGGNPVSVPVPYSFPVRAAAMAFLINQQSFIMVSPIMPPPPNALIMSGGSLTTPPPSITTFSYTSAPGGNSSFEGQAVSTTNVTLNGPTTEIVYFTISPFEWVGQTSFTPAIPSYLLPSTSQYTVYANQVPLPVMATIGSSGPLDTGTDYTDSTKKTVVDTFAQTWTLIAGETPDLPYFCTTTVVVTSVKPINLRGPNTSFCLRIDFNGDVLGESLSYIGTSEGTLTFTN